ncbi:MAG: transglycosylase domain-containing protein, partial [Chloroflexi bacterium]|nr:transglycosylase domain-containing protein [Chloroflexota bacterium]
LSEISPWLTKATISVEDPDFEENVGINYRGLARAAMENFTPFGGGFLEGSGGSSITQQLAKNVYIPREERLERSVTRKIEETAIAIELTNKYSKEQIFEWYLNSISYGGLYVGIEAASEGYFGKPAKDLTLPEAALLAGIPQSPAAYDPFSPENIDSKGQLFAEGYAKWRQGEVLKLMVRREVITQAESDAAFASPVQFNARRFEIEAPHFVLGRIAEELRRRFGERALRDQGLEVTTTLDLNLQHKAETIVAKTLTDFGDAAGAHNGAFVALDPKTGQILTYLGSRDYFDDEIEGRNDNVMARNSPGSTLKPFAYMGAFMNGWGTATTILDTPVAIADPSTGGTFSPRNPTGNYLGPIAADKALGNSLNVSAIKTIIAAGVQNTIGLLQKVGYTTFDNEGGYGPALITGGSEVTLMDQAIAYAVLANNGVMRGQDAVVTERKANTRTLEAVALLKVTDSEKKVLYEFKQPVERRVIPAEYAWLVTSILSNGDNSCITYGVCNALGLPNGYPSAAKTGTSAPFDDFRLIGETWTIGYTPDLVGGVWAGNADNAPIQGIDSTTVSLRSWKLWMVEALEELKHSPTAFSRPNGIVEREVCWPSGRIPTDDCPQMNRFTSLYVAEQIPSDPKEQGKVADTWWQKIAIDTRTGMRATPETSPTFVLQQVRLVLPAEEAKGWGGLREWAAKAGILPLLAPDDGPQDGPLPALITSPQAGQGVGGNVTIVGRADSPDLERYTLEWGRGAQPASWVRITTSTARVIGGPLGTWDVRALPNGTYTLRVRLEDKILGTRMYAVPVSITGAAAGDAAPTLIVTSPAEGAVLTGAVTINGVALSGKFTEVRTEIGSGLNPTSWLPVERKTAPVLNSTIASWNTTAVEDGAYTLRIVLADAAFGEAVTEMTVIVRNKATTATPTPTPRP